MKVVVAIDSFKGSLSSMMAGEAIREGILRAKPEADVTVKPLADGGEGTTDALIDGMKGERVPLDVTGPFGKAVRCYYGYLKESQTAVMEMASAAGITLEPTRDPIRATTRGVGEMILDAVEKGCRDFIIGIGGSATNDGGIGMLRALGYEFYDKDGKEAGEGGGALARVASFSETNADPRLKECRFRVACDVTNPLCGSMGATYIYGPQKGVTEEMKEELDRGMANYAKVVSANTGKDYAGEPGAGAAGGLGFAFLRFLGAELVPGVELILNAVGLENEMADADIAVTGEGRLDHQTAMGKAPIGVARMAKKYGARVIAFAGSVAPGAEACNAAGIDAFFPIIRGICTLDEAMEPQNARENLMLTTEQVFRLL